MTDLFLSYLNAGFFGCVIILVGLLLRPLLRKAPRRILCAVWLLAAVRLLLPINFESHFSLQPGYTPSAAVSKEQWQQAQDPLTSPEQVRPSPSLPEIDTDFGDVSQGIPVIPETQVKPNPETPPMMSEQQGVEESTTAAPEAVNTTQIIAIVWVAVMAALGVYGIISYVVLKRRVRTAVKCADGVRECEHINSAFLLGYWRPEIYLPLGIAPCDRAFIITHEQTHKRRGDHWRKLIGLLCVVVHWYNPLVWVGYIMMCRDVEIACDEQVVASMNLEDRKAYSLALLNSGKRTSGILACPVAFGEVNLKQRIKKVLAYCQPSFWITAVAITLVVFVGLCFLTSPIVEPEDNTDTMPSVTQPTNPSTVPMEPSATQPTDPSTVPTEPSVTQPTDPSTVPTEPPVTQPIEPTKPGEITVIAGDKWKNTTVRWEITSDGMLSFSGDRYIRSSDTYPWKDYSNQITKIIIADGITTIPSEVFSGMHKVTELYLSNTLEIMGDGAFSGCTALESVTIPANLEEIPLRAFYGCTNLSKLEFAPDCQVTIIRAEAFANSGLATLSTPSSLRTIDVAAFRNCYNLQKVVLDGGVQVVNGGAFTNCRNLTHLVLGESLTMVNTQNVFSGCTAIETVEIYSNLIAGFPNQTSLRSAIIGGKVYQMRGFEGCKALSSVVIEAPIGIVSDYVFYGCSSLTSITLPDTVCSIGMEAFTQSGITKLVLPASVMSLEFWIVNSEIQEIVFTGDCPKMSNQIFEYSNATVYYPADNDTWTEEKMQACIGNITWVPYTESESEGIL